MGNAHGALAHCFLSSSADEGGQRRGRRRWFFSSSAVTSENSPDEGLGHSFRYVPPLPPPPLVPPPHAASANLTKVCHSDHETSASFPSITGAAISANPAAPSSTALLAAELLPRLPAASFESSRSFASVPLQRLHRLSASSCSSSSSSGGGPFSGPLSAAGVRGFMSAPLDNRAASLLFSGPLDKQPPAAFSAQLSRSSSHGPPRRRRSSAAAAAFRGFTKAVGRAISGGSGSAEGLTDSNSIDAGGGVHQRSSSSSSNWLSSGGGNSSSSSNISCGGDAQWSDAPEPHLNGAYQWAQGKAGEDRVHVVVSEEHGWVFVGIYDGFNGPDATDFLLSNLYPAVHQELKGILWEDKEGSNPSSLPACCVDSDDPSMSTNADARKNRETKSTVDKENRQQHDSHWDNERMELGRKLRDKLRRSNVNGAANHLQVLKALSRALKKTEETFFDIADKMASENPELALMGSCVLVMLMKGEDVYLMNVGDSRAVMAEQARKDLRSIKEEYAADVGGVNGYGGMDGLKNLKAMQLTLDHNTSVEEEVRRIRKEHPRDSSAIANGRVKGSLKVTRAFGAGFLKQPKWNDALLEMFRIDYVGASPYISCSPFLYHHKLRPMDKFLILSSDGLYQYFTNEEVAAQVEKFVAATPDGDPAQHLVEQVLLRAAKRAGMDLQELLSVPHGERRQYHDDISIVIISLEGQIWRSWV